jgi:hypothetical protein
MSGIKRTILFFVFICVTIGYRYLGAMDGHSQQKRNVSIDIFSRLPDEVAVHVLSYLDPSGLKNAQQVCRNWCRLIKDPLFDWCNRYLKHARNNMHKAVILATKESDICSVAQLLARGARADYVDELG